MKKWVVLSSFLALFMAIGVVLSIKLIRVSEELDYLKQEYEQFQQIRGAMPARNELRSREKILNELETVVLRLGLKESIAEKNSKDYEVEIILKLHSQDEVNQLFRELSGLDQFKILRSQMSRSSDQILRISITFQTL